jgi:hypothetical protein
MNINFLWSKGLYSRNEYMLKGTNHKDTSDNIKNEILNAEKYIWIRNGCHNYAKGIVNLNTKSDLDILAENLDLIKTPLFLITTDGDRPVPSSYLKNTVDKILNSNKIIKWMTQNYDKTIIHPKLDYYPIGLDLHTTRWLINNSALQKIDFIKNIRNENKNKNKIFCDAHLHATSNERTKMHNKLKNNNDIIFLEKGVSYKEITNLYNSYQFVLSPEGNGLDCHRTWELFLLGCIVITKKSSLDDLWIKHNLPVVILDKWGELNNDLNNKLDIWFKKYIQFTQKDYILNKFTNDYWLSII